MNKPGDIQIFRSHGENGGGGGNNTSNRVFGVIEGGNPGGVDSRKFKIDMIRNERPQYILQGVSETNYYRRDLQFGREDIEKKDYLSGMMDNYYDYIHGELYDLKDKIEECFMSFFSQEHKSYNTIEDLIQSIDRVIIHIGEQIHPYQWKFLKQILESFFKDLNSFVDTLDTGEYVPDVMEKIYGWVYFHENGGIIGEGLRSLSKEFENKKVQQNSFECFRERVIQLLQKFSIKK